MQLSADLLQRFVANTVRLGALVAQALFLLRFVFLIIAVEKRDLRIALER